jgi:molybdopterin molybdotransferase
MTVSKILISVLEAEQIIQESLLTLREEDCALEKIAGRVLRQKIIADRQSPPFNRATMDGITFRFSDWESGKRVFSIEGTIAAGQSEEEGPSLGSCVEIMTGAAVPDACDVVVRYEDVSIVEGIATVADEAVVNPGLAIHPIGSDYKENEVLVEEGCRIGGKEAAVAASCGYETLKVARNPIVAFVSTGDELVDVEDIPKPHEIRRSNDTAVKSALYRKGYTSVETSHQPDNPETLRWELERVLMKSDVVIISGGISKGKFDYIPSILKELGVECKFHGVEQRPGKPMWFGVHSRDGDFFNMDEEIMVPVFALPGNPVSSYVCLHRFVLPALAKMSGMGLAQKKQAVLSQAATFKPPLTYFLPVQSVYAENSQLLVKPVPFNTSGDFASLVKTDGFLELPKEQADFPEGYQADFYGW